MPMERLPNGSATTGPLPKGCVQCEKGAKMVLLITGECVCQCFYCPLSEEKQNRDSAYANERIVTDLEDLIEEARAIDAEGTGITGGDPLMQMTRTVIWIQTLKDCLGDGHHIHLYTATPDIDKIEMLAVAGLDEIRFHPPPEAWCRFGRTRYPGAIAAAREMNLAVGLEIPVLPDMENETMALLESAEKAGAQFVNLNELEFSDTNWRELKKRGYEIKDDVGSSARGSEEMAYRIMSQGSGPGRNVKIKNGGVNLSGDGEKPSGDGEKPSGEKENGGNGGVKECGHGERMPLHYCSASFKDGIQLRRRIMRRAQNTATDLEIITDDGTFIIGIVETDEPDIMMDRISDEFDVPGELMRVDFGRRRVEIAAWVLEEINSALDAPCFVVEEYPTADRLEVERTPL